MKKMKRQRTRTTKPRRMAVTKPRTTLLCCVRSEVPGEELARARASLQLQPGAVQHWGDSEETVRSEGVETRSVVYPDPTLTLTRLLKVKDFIRHIDIL